ncbi:MAG: TonB-dependent receptor, partial [Bacteroidetes bacterium]|nr:TonB-dependent receptor [Bacteroidota bacterium]
GLGGRLKPDSVTTIQVSANYTIGLQNENRFSDINSFNNKLGQLSTGDIDQLNKTNTYYYKHNVGFTRLSKTKKGRRYSISQSLDINNRFNDYITNAQTQYRYPFSSDSLLYQLRSERIPRTDAVTSFNYSEPLGKKTTLRIGSRHEYSKLDNGITTYNKPDSNAKYYDIYNNQLSSHFARESNRFLVNVGFEYRFKNLTITPAIRGQGQYVSNRLASLPAAIKQDRFDLLPLLTIVYKQLNINYSKDIQLPSYTYMLPVTDNTNPYYINKGNPDLVPAERHNVSLNYSFNDPKRSLNINVYANGSLINNDVVQSYVVNQQGVQTTTPVNVNGTRNAYVYYGINKQYKTKQNFIFSFNIGNNINYNHNRLLYNGENSWQTNWSISGWAGANLNWNDKIEWNTSYGLNTSFSRYTSTVFKKLDVVNHTWDNELVVRWPKHIIWESQINYTYSGNLPAGYDKNIVRWNGGV